jgi:hypothetical protein
MENNMKWIPKGSMCASCKRAAYNCSHLPFHTMPHLVVKHEDGERLVIVKCTEYERGKDDE